jgi:hypothetical protein
MMSKVVAKLKADRAHGLALVPFRPDTVWWTTLQQATSRMSEMTAAEAIDCTRIAEHARMYSVVNWRVCAFSFDADGERCYPVQCTRSADWEVPRVSPKELDHHRRLEALIHFELLGAERSTRREAKIGDC